MIGADKLGSHMHAILREASEKFLLSKLHQLICTFSRNVQHSTYIFGDTPYYMSINRPFYQLQGAALATDSVI
jgi:hypothetical protein